MKFIVLTLMVAISYSCSKDPSRSNPFPVNIESSPNISIEPLIVSTVLTDGKVTVPSSSLNFSLIPSLASATQELVIRTGRGPNPFLLTEAEFDTSELAPFTIYSNNCIDKSLGEDQSCRIVFQIKNSSRLEDESISRSVTILGQVVSLTATLQRNLLSPTDPISGINISPTLVNFGNISAGDYREFDIVVANYSPYSQPISMTTNTVPKIIEKSNSCPEILEPRKKCVLRVRYVAGLDEVVNNKPFKKIANIQLSYSVNVVTLAAPTIVNVNPSKVLSQINLIEPEILKSTISFKNEMLTTFPAPVKVISSNPGVILNSYNCSSSGIRSRSACSVTYSLNSKLLPSGFSNQTIRIQAGNNTTSSPLIIPVFVEKTPLVCPAGYVVSGTECQPKNYSLFTEYSDYYMAMSLLPLKIYKNGVRCEGDCLDSFSQGDRAQISVQSDSLVGVSDFEISGNRTTENRISQQDISFRFVDSDISVKINLAVGGIQSTEEEDSSIPSTPVQIPNPNPENGTTLSVRCYTKDGVDRLSSRLSLEPRHTIPAYIISRAEPEEQDNLNVDTVPVPTFYGWIKYQGSIMQCYNFSESAVKPSDYSTSCEQRMAAWKQSNPNICNPNSGLNYGESSTTTTPGGYPDLCEDYGVGCNFSIPTGPDSSLCRLFAIGCGGGQVFTPSVNMCATFNIGCNGEIIPFTGPNSALCKVTGICGGDLPNLENACKIFGLCNSKVPAPSVYVKIDNFCNVMNLCDENAICSSLGIGCKGGPLIGPDSVVCKMLGSSCDGPPRIETNLCKSLGLGCAAPSLGSVTCKLTGLGCGSGDGFAFSPCQGFGLGCGDDAGEIINNVGDSFVTGIDQLGNQIQYVTDALGQIKPKIDTEQITEYGVALGQGVGAGASYIFDSAGSVLGSVDASQLNQEFNNAIEVLQIDEIPGLSSTFPIDSQVYTEVGNVLGDAGNAIATGAENLIKNIGLSTPSIGGDWDGGGIKTCVPSVSCKVSCKCKAWKPKCKCSVGCTVKTCVKASTGGISDAISSAAGGVVGAASSVASSGCAFPNSCGGGITGGWAPDYGSIGGGWNAIVDGVTSGVISAGDIVSGVGSAVVDGVRQIDFGDPSTYCERLGICGATIPNSCQLFNANCPVSTTNSENSFSGFMCRNLQVNCPLYRLQINFSDAELAKEIAYIKVYQNGQLCTGDCLNQFQSGDDTVVIIKTNPTALVSDIQASGTIIRDELIINGVSFPFNNSDVVLNVNLGYNMFSYFSQDWNAGQLLTRTRSCVSQPSNSTGGMEVSSDGGLTYGSCIEFTCNSGYTKNGNICVQNVATVTVVKNPNQTTQVLDISYGKLNCSGSCSTLSKQYDLGSNIVFSATAAPGYIVSSWLGCDALINGNTQCAIDNIQSSKNITPVMTPIDYKFSYETSDALLALNITNVVILKNNVACSGNCLNTFHVGDLLQIGIATNGYTKTSNFEQTGTVTNFVQSVNNASFNFGANDVHSYITLVSSILPSSRSLAVSGYHTCAIMVSDDVKCTGFNSSGQLGTGNFSNTSTPVVVSGFAGAKFIATGPAHTCAIMANDSVRCTGANSLSQLGNGSSTNLNTPTNIPGFAGAKVLALGKNHTCAIMLDDSVRCAGSNSSGQLGISGGTKSTPTNIPGFAGAKALALGGSHTCAIMADNSVKCTGLNASGQLGTGDNVSTNTPITIPGFAGAKKIAAADLHTCAIMADNTVKCTGYNSEGQLGNGDRISQNTPITISGFGQVKAVTGGDDHTCAILLNDTVKCAGSNRFGQFGNGGSLNSVTPVSVLGFNGVKVITAGSTHTCAIMGDDSIRCTGRNNYGQFGNGTTTDSNVPVTSSGF